MSITGAKAPVMLVSCGWFGILKVVRRLWRWIMSQPCSAVELVLFDAGGLSDPKIRAEVESAIKLGVLTGAVADQQGIADMIDAAGQADRFGFWFGGQGNWPFDRAIAFANVDPGRVLFVSNDPAARDAAVTAGVRVVDAQMGEIATLLP